MVDSLARISGYAMSFGIVDGTPIIISGDRNNMVFGNSVITKQTVLHVYSTSKGLELLNNFKSGEVLLQEREKAFTVQFNNQILEMGILCPPFCIE